MKKKFSALFRGFKISDYRMLLKSEELKKFIRTIHSSRNHLTDSLF